ncbi:MAG: hypothetical protein KKB70_05250 [Proteobacteria bacterium]|nr:hypothetical protein [Pseudomonadota bacterium]
MSKILNLDEMLDALGEAGHVEHAGLVSAVSLVGEKVAEVFANHFGVNSKGFSMEEMAFGGGSASFSPARQGQAWPKELDAYDPSGDFE